jgi:phosphate-selective porin OprO and OprP
MKLRLTLISFAFILIASVAKAQTPDDVLNLLIAKGTITQQEADSLRADYAIKQQDVKAKQKTWPVNAGGKFFQIGGYSQVRYQDFQKQTVNPQQGFDLRRLRLDLTGSFDPQFDYRLQVDFVGASGQTGTVNGGAGTTLIAPTGGSLLSPTVIDAYIVYKPLKDYLKFTAGQFYIPFSLENVSSDKNLELIDRSQVVSALVARKGDASNSLVDSIGNQNGRDIGLQASGSLIPFNGGSFVDYYVAYLNGAGIDVADNNKSKDVSTRVVIHPVKGLDFGASYYNGYDKFTSGTTGDRFRWGGELAYAYKAFTFKSEIITGQDGNTLQKHIDHQGGYIQAGYFFVPKKLQIVAKYDTYDPNTIVHGSQSTYYILGANYFFNSWAKIQVDYRKADGKGAINNGNDLFSTQLQIAF